MDNAVNLSTMSATFNDSQSQIPLSHASNVSTENQSSCLVDLSLLLIIRTGLVVRSSEQLVIESDLLRGKQRNQAKR